MAISTGMKIGIASGFMARREKIAEDQKEETKDFGKATDASIKTANQILRVESERDAAEIVAGKGILQHEVLAPILKGKNISDDMIRKVGIEAQALKKAGSSVKSIALALQKQIANETIKLEETQAKEQRDEQLQQALVDKAKENNTSNKIATALAQGLSGSARGEAARDLIRQRITPDQQEVMDRGNTYKERKPSLGLSPERKNTMSEMRSMNKTLIEANNLGDFNLATGEMKYKSDLADTKEDIGAIISALSRSYEEQYAPEEVGILSSQLTKIIDKKGGEEFLSKNKADIIRSILEFGAKPTVESLLKGEILGQKEPKVDNPKVKNPKVKKPVSDSGKKTDEDFKDDEMPLPEGAKKIDKTSTVRSDGRMDTQYRLPDGKIVVIINNGTGTYYKK
tara:strand:+ start:215 stop:1408 length:1194 start_codon:yes stop_codon:yes gene_type:complete